MVRFVLVLFLAVLVVLLTGFVVFADEYEGDEEGFGEFGEELGSVAAWGGFVLIGGFVLFRRVFPFLVRAGLVRGWVYGVVLRFHMVSSLGLGVAGLVHGWSMRGYAGVVEYLLVGVIVFTLLSGLVLWFSRGRVRRFARFIHVQRLLSVLIIVLLLLHVSLVED